MMIDTGANASIMSRQVAQQLGIMGTLDRSYAGTCGGIGSAQMLGRVSGLGVTLGELTVEMDFMVLDATQMPSKGLILLGLD
mgnify:CR=1 FL=1